MAGAIRVTMEVGADGVAVVTICNPPVNALHPISRPPRFLISISSSFFFWFTRFVSDSVCSDWGFLLLPAVIQGLKEKYAEAMDRDDVKAIVLTGEASC
mgnify:CR=1 FL=1